jgi:hypothetical protein
MNKFLLIHRFCIRGSRARAQNFTNQALRLHTNRSLTLQQDDVIISLSNNPGLV